MFTEALFTVAKISAQFCGSVMSDFLWPHGLQHAWLPCPSPTPGACSNSCPLSWWCHPAISSSVIPFSSCLQSYQASGSFLMSQVFTSGGQSIGDSAKIWKQPNTFNRWTVKEYVVYMYEYYSVIKKDETLPFVIWDIQSIMLSEISHTEKDKCCMNSLVYVI